MYSYSRIKWKIDSWLLVVYIVLYHDHFSYTTNQTSPKSHFQNQINQTAKRLELKEHIQSLLDLKQETIQFPPVSSPIQIWPRHKTNWWSGYLNQSLVYMKVHLIRNHTMNTNITMNTNKKTSQDITKLNLIRNSYNHRKYNEFIALASRYFIR